MKIYSEGTILKLCRSQTPSQKTKKTKTLSSVSANEAIVKENKVFLQEKRKEEGQEQPRWGRTNIRPAGWELIVRADISVVLILTMYHALL